MTPRETNDREVLPDKERRKREQKQIKIEGNEDIINFIENKKI